MAVTAAASAPETEGAPRPLLWGAVVVEPLPRRSGYEWAELALFGVVLLLSFATAPRTADGRANAPGMDLIESTTGGGICVWRRSMETECGGCGLTRGFVQLAHGDVVAAVGLNPLTPIVFGWVLWRFLDVALKLGRARTITLGLPGAWRLNAFVAVWFGFIALGAYRFVTG